MKSKVSLFIYALIVSCTMLLIHYDCFAVQLEGLNNQSVRWNNKLGTPWIIYGRGIPLGNTVKLSQDNIADFAKAFIESNKDFLGVLTEDIRLKNIRHINDNWGVKFQQYYRNIPVEGGIIGISITDRGFINLIGNGYYPRITVSTTPGITQSNAEEIAKNQYEQPRSARVRRSILVVLPVEKLESFEYHLAWKIEIHYLENLLNSKAIYVDAFMGSVLKQKRIMLGGIAGTVNGYIWPTAPVSDVYPPMESRPFSRETVKLYGTQYKDDTDENGNYSIPQGQAGVDQVYSTLENDNLKLVLSENAPLEQGPIDEYLSTEASWTWSDTSNHGGEYNVFYWLNQMYGYCFENFDYDIGGTRTVTVYMYHTMTGAWSDIYISTALADQASNKTILHEYSHVVQCDLGLTMSIYSESWPFCEGQPTIFHVLF